MPLGAQKKLMERGVYRNILFMKVFIANFTKRPQTLIDEGLG
jgi:hypothetical protein